MILFVFMFGWAFAAETDHFQARRPGSCNLSAINHRATALQAKLNSHPESKREDVLFSQMLLFPQTRASNDEKVSQLYSCDVDARTRAERIQVGENGGASFYQGAVDSSDVSNRVTNDLLSKAAEGANLEARAKEDKGNCERSVLFRNIYEVMVGSNFSTSNVERAIQRSGEVALSVSAPSESVYRNFNSSDGVLYASDYVNRACCAPLQKIGSTVVSGDKLDHFFMGGYFYHRVAGDNTDPTKSPRHKWSPPIVENLDSAWQRILTGLKIQTAIATRFGNLRDALELGVATETGSLGLQTNGIFSYADLAANYQGLRFFQEAVEGKNPFFVCHNGSWHRSNRKFDWNEYVDAAWDESINCNTYGSPSTEKKVLDQIHKSGFKGCPVEADTCRKLGPKYAAIQEYVLHPSCRTSAAATGQEPRESQTKQEGAVR